MLFKKAVIKSKYIYSLQEVGNDSIIERAMPKAVDGSSVLNHVILRAAITTGIPNLLA